MSIQIKKVQILNFKSLRDVKLQCARINLLVGKPNVGKSNLLEALALTGASFLNNGKGFAKPQVRYEQVANLFYDQRYYDEKIEVRATGIGHVQIAMDRGIFRWEMTGPGTGRGLIAFQPDGNIVELNISRDSLFSSVKPYRFVEEQTFDKKDQLLFLRPPIGENLPEILQANKTIRQEISGILEPYGLHLYVKGSHLDLVKTQDGVLFDTPFSLVADTLRRYLFHFAAIESNRDSVLLFEEPESHNYPPYITRLAHRIIAEESNQYFITTHSPFLFNTLIEEAKDVAVFLVEYEDFQTKVRRLTEENLREMLDYGLNIFTQQELFV